MIDPHLEVIDELHRLAHEHPDIPILVRNIQGSEVDGMPENDRCEPYYLGDIAGVTLGRFYTDEDATLFDDGEPSDDDIEYAFIMQGRWDWEDEDWPPEKCRDEYERLPWRPAIIVSIGAADVA